MRTALSEDGCFGTICAAKWLGALHAAAFMTRGGGNVATIVTRSAPGSDDRPSVEAVCRLTGRSGTRADTFGVEALLHQRAEKERGERSKARAPRAGSTLQARSKRACTHTPHVHDSHQHWPKRCRKFGAGNTPFGCAEGHHAWDEGL